MDGLGGRRTRACARDTLILAFSHEGRRDPMAALGAWLTPSRACARDTLILAFSRKGRKDPLAGIHSRFRMACLTATDWIPAFAGMTGG